MLAQEISWSLVDFFPNSTSYISASYVKYLEAAGARVVPVLINQVTNLKNIIFLIFFSPEYGILAFKYIDRVPHFYL